METFDGGVFQRNGLEYNHRTSFGLVVGRLVGDGLRY